MRSEGSILESLHDTFSLREVKKKEKMADSSVIPVLRKNLKLTDRVGNGPVVVVTSRSKLAVSLRKNKDGEWDNSTSPRDSIETHRIQMSFKSGGKWSVVDSKGVGKAKKKTITDEEATRSVEAIFKKAKT